jgi:hypothetical protein
MRSPSPHLPDTADKQAGSSRGRGCHVDRRVRTTAAVIATLAIVALVAPGCAGATSGGSSDRGSVREPLVIGHRGASGYRPEHTLAFSDNSDVAVAVRHQMFG